MTFIFFEFQNYMPERFFDYDIVIDIVHVLLVIMPETAASSSTRNRPSKYYWYSICVANPLIVPKHWALIKNLKSELLHPQAPAGRRPIQYAIVYHIKTPRPFPYSSSFLMVSRVQVNLLWSRYFSSPLGTIYVMHFLYIWGTAIFFGL